MKKNVYIVKGVSKTGNEYYKLYVDFGYAELPLTFNVAEIAQYLDMRPSQITSLKVNEKKLVATFDIKGE